MPPLRVKLLMLEIALSLSTLAFTNNITKPVFNTEPSNTAIATLDS
jgi:hypothetical protein